MGVPTPFLAVIGASAGYGQVYRTQKHRKPLAGTPSHARRARYQAVAPNRSDLGLRPAPPRRPTCGKRWLRALAVGATRPARLPSSVVLTRNARRLTYYEERAACCLLINSLLLHTHPLVRLFVFKNNIHNREDPDGAACLLLCGYCAVSEDVVSFLVYV